MLSIMCSNCSNLAADLLKNTIADTLCYLLTGSLDGVNGKEEVTLILNSHFDIYLQQKSAIIYYYRLN